MSHPDAIPQPKTLLGKGARAAVYGVVLGGYGAYKTIAWACKKTASVYKDVSGETVRDEMDRLMTKNTEQMEVLAKTVFEQRQQIAELKAQIEGKTPPWKGGP